MKKRYAEAKGPEDLVMLWVCQNATDRKSDQEAFDKLPDRIRFVVNDSPIQLSCEALLASCQRFGQRATRIALQEQLANWINKKQT